MLNPRAMTAQSVFCHLRGALPQVIAILTVAAAELFLAPEAIVDVIMRIHPFLSFRNYPVYMPA